MEHYSLAFKKSAEKDLRKIPKEIIPHIFEHVEKLAGEPVPHDAYKLAVQKTCTGSVSAIIVSSIRCCTKAVK